MSTAAGTSAEPLRLPGFRTFWTASTLGFFGLSITTLAVDVLVIRGLHATSVQVGEVRAAQFAPYLLIGLIAGALVDRWRRRPTLMVTNLAQGLLLLLIPALWWLDALTVWVVAGVLLVTGSFAGLEDPNEMGYWRAVTPREVLGRVYATRRSANRSTAVVGALLGGLVAAVLGLRDTLAVVTAVFRIAGLVAALSPLRGARA